jgi:hypothetical protein
MFRRIPILIIASACLAGCSMAPGFKFGEVDQNFCLAAWLDGNND